MPHAEGIPLAATIRTRRDSSTLFGMTTKDFFARCTTDGLRRELFGTCWSIPEGRRTWVESRLVQLPASRRIGEFHQFCRAFPCRRLSIEDEKPGISDACQGSLAGFPLRYWLRAEIWESGSCNVDKQHRGMIAVIVLGSY